MRYIVPPWEPAACKIHGAPATYVREPAARMNP